MQKFSGVNLLVSDGAKMALEQLDSLDESTSILYPSVAHDLF